MDKEGYITIVDRKKDRINTGGVNVSSREVKR
jgi:fatty-acyl-CoA synthase